MNGLSSPDSRHRKVQVEDLHVRNYDDDEHVLGVRAVSEDGTVAVERSYRLAGHDSTSELDALLPGTYDVEVELDGVRKWVQQCKLADDSSRGILVETGNGTISITSPDRKSSTENGG